MAFNAGIYLIQNNITGQIYIGQAKCLSQRLFKHIYSRNTKDRVQKIDYDIAKYGIENFSIKILKIFEPLQAFAFMDFYEEYYIAKYQPEYNTNFGKHTCGYRSIKDGCQDLNDKDYAIKNRAFNTWENVRNDFITNKKARFEHCYKRYKELRKLGCKKWQPKPLM